MSSRGTYIDAEGVAHVDDFHGWSVPINVRRLPLMLDYAKAADDGRAPFALRWFDRDLLQGAVDLAVDKGLLETCTAPNCERATVFDLADTRPCCTSHKEDKR